LASRWWLAVASLPALVVGGLAGVVRAGDDPGTVEDDWLGAPMFFSGYTAEIGKRLVETAGLFLVRADEITEVEDGVPVTFLWIVAQKPLSLKTEEN
jgi:hypothetical protein